ncbi:hypothetical protein Q7W37_08290 [Streptococcus suis]|nr:hypothetical protein [Streptococcus suis]
MKTNLLRATGLLALGLRFFFYFLILCFLGFAFSKDVSGSLEYTFNQPIAAIGWWKIISAFVLILLALLLASHIAGLFHKLTKELVKEDYFSSASQMLYRKLFMSLVALTATQFCLTLFISLTKAVGPHNFLNLRWSDFLINGSFLILTYVVWLIVQKGEKLQLENSEII